MEATRAESGRWAERVNGLEKTLQQQQDLSHQFEAQRTENAFLASRNAALEERARRVADLEDADARRELFLQTQRQQTEQKLAVLQQNAATAQAWAEARQREIVQLTAQLSELNGVRTQLEEANRHLATTQEQQRHDFEKIRVLQDDFTSLKARVEGEERRRVEARVEADTLLEKVKQLEERVAEQRGQLQIREQKIAEQRAAFERNLADQERAAQFEERAKRAETELAEFRQHDGQLQNDLARYKAQLTAEVRRVEVSERELGSLREGYEELRIKWQKELEARTRLEESRQAQEQQMALYASDLERERGERLNAQRRLDEVRLTEGKLHAGLTAKTEEAEGLSEALRLHKEEAVQWRSKAGAAAEELAMLRAELNAERSQHQDKLKLLSEARDELANQFKAVASDILQQNSQQFSELNQERLGKLLDPLRTQLHVFQEKVEQVHLEETRQGAELKANVDRLAQLNQVICEEARQLTRALKGEAKVQGDWGEMILNRILDLAGLQEGRDYSAQQCHHKEEGGYSRPDIVLNLPEHRSLVVDAKVSLKAYEAYTRAESETERRQHLQAHLTSMRGHIDALAKKNYAGLTSLQTLSFVVMFVPLEPAYSLAINEDMAVWHEAWRKGVMLVTPTTLLFVVRMVAHLWQQEKQNQNAKGIAQQGARLFDKVATFVEDFEKVGRALHKAQDSFEDAKKKLVGNQGVIRQTAKLKSLGVPTSKSLNPSYATAAGLDEVDDGSYEPLDAALRPQ